jgi:hypothetical protein
LIGVILSLVASVVGFEVGGALGIWIGSLLIGPLGVSGFEGGAGYFCVMTGAIGGMICAVLGAGMALYFCAIRPSTIRKEAKEMDHPQQ